MRFLNPAGLWLLLGVPILIIIYLIKAQHEERSVSSTYIWKLSNRFMKKRLPIQRINKILLFILQLLMIITVALMVARPVIIKGKSCEYIVIIDGSASMQIADEDGVTRFERAIESVKELGKNIEDGHKVSVILATDNADYLIQSADTVNKLTDALSSAKAGLGGCDIEGAISKAEFLTEKKANVEIIFYTDCDYEESTNVNVVNLNKNEWNVVIENVSVTTDETNTVVKGVVTSYNADTTLAVGLRVDGSVEKAQFVDLEKDVATQVEFTISNQLKYDTLEIFTKEEDGLSEDNSYSLCRKTARTYGVLLASASPFYIESVLNALGNCKVTTVSDVAATELAGYDLYIFDGIAPAEYPEDGSIILMGTDNLPDGVYAGEVAESGASLEAVVDASEDIYKEIYAGISLSEAVVSKYSKLSCSGRWETVLECDGEPVCVTRELDGGRKFTVMSFDLHNSNLPLLIDYILFMRNLVEYSVPSLIKSTDYAIGESVKLTVMPAAKELYVELPDEHVNQLSMDEDTIRLIPNQLGIYTVVMATAEGGEYADFFVHIPNGETSCRNMEKVEAHIGVSDKEQAEVDEAYVELWYYLAAVLLVLLLVEWGCYYYEQY